jgi:hypothetical protein
VLPPEGEPAGGVVIDVCVLIKLRDTVIYPILLHMLWIALSVDTINLVDLIIS